jgi:hypothetical protein
MAPYAALVDGSSSNSSGSSSRVNTSRSSADGLIVKLVRNYRSHEKLLQLPSQLFYQGELRACASPEITDTLLHWDKLPNKQYAPRSCLLSDEIVLCKRACLALIMLSSAWGCQRLHMPNVALCRHADAVHSPQK